MATNTQEGVPAAVPSPSGNAEESTAELTSITSSGGGLKAWLPLIVTVVAMPALAYVTTAFILMPRMQKAVAAAVAAQAGPATPATAAGAAPSAEVKPAVEAPAPKPKEAAKDKAGEKGKEADGLDPALKERGAKITTAGKMTVPMNKILVNISGSMGSRYLLASLTLASDKEGFGQLILSNEAQLLDLAAGVLGSKTIADLEKPEARTVVRSELQTVFNNALGPNMVQDVYLTEFAIQ